MNTHFVKLIATCCAVGLFIGCGNVPQNYTHREEIVDVLRQYRDAIANKDAAKATQLVTSDSLKRFEEFRNWAVHDSAEQLKQRSLYEQIHVLSLRHHLGGQDLTQQSGKEIFGGLIRSGGMSTKLLANARFGNCVFDHPRKLCFVQLFDQQQPTKYRITCLQEDTGWKVHLIGMEGIEAKSYQAIMDNRDISQNDLIQRIVSDWTQKGSTIDLWQPLHQPS